jgi:hypothetical protein
MFGDFDPEDAWDDTDPVERKIAMLDKIAHSINGDPDETRRSARHVNAERLLVKLRVVNEELATHLDRIEEALHG